MDTVDLRKFARDNVLAAFDHEVGHPCFLVRLKPTIFPNAYWECSRQAMTWDAADKWFQLNAGNSSVYKMMTRTQGWVRWVRGFGAVSERNGDTIVWTD